MKLGRARRASCAAALVAAAAALSGCAGPAAFDGRPYLAKLEAIEKAGRAGAADLSAYQLVLAAGQAAARLRAYTARFEKQERLGLLLRPLEEVDVAIREEPLSVHMKWVGRMDRGKEALYVEGENDDRIRVYAGQLPAPMVLNVEPESAAAMQGNRYPITRMGLRTLARGLLRSSGEAEAAPAGSFHRLGRLEMDGRTIEIVGRRMTAASSAAGRPPETLLAGIDLQTGLAVLMSRYGPATGGKTELLELYRYRRLSLAATLTDADFDFSRVGGK